MMICRVDLAFCHVAIKEREQQALQNGWRRKPYELKVLKDNLSHEERAAWKLLRAEIPRLLQKGRGRRRETAIRSGEKTESSPDCYTFQNALFRL